MTTEPEQWLTSQAGWEYVIANSGRGMLRRQGDETVEQARARQAVRLEERRAEQRKPGSTRTPRPKGRRPDRPPKVGPAPAAASSTPKVTAEQLAAAAEIPFSILGSFVGNSVLGCQFCAKSMSDAAPAAAMDLARSKNPYVHNLLVYWHGIVSTLMQGGGQGIAGFLIVPAVHHVAPAPIAKLVSPVLGIPPRPDRPTPQRHEHGPARAETREPEQTMTSPRPKMPTGPLTPQDADRIARERAAMQSEVMRLTQIREMQRRQQAAAANLHGPNHPPYDARIPEAPASVTANGREPAPGTPMAPPMPDGADDAGSPLPPEAFL